MAQPGQILNYQDYVFENGSKRNKLFVVLNMADMDSPCLVLKTTSQSERYKGATQGCDPQKRVFLVPAGQETCFRVDTYIQLPEIFEISTKQLLEGTLSNKNIDVLEDSLSSDCFAQLKNCLKKFKEDISQQHWKLIFQP